MSLALHMHPITRMCAPTHKHTKWIEKISILVISSALTAFYIYGKVCGQGGSSYSISNLLTSVEIWLFNVVISQTFCDSTSCSNQYIISTLLSSSSVNMKRDYHLLNKLKFPFPDPLPTCSFISTERRFFNNKISQQYLSRCRAHS